MKNKKGYVFTVDIILAVIILLLGFGFIYLRFFQPEGNDYVVDRLGHDVIGVMSEAKVTDLCVDVGSYSCSCPRYGNLSIMVCSNLLLQPDTDLLSMTSEVIERNLFPRQRIEGMFREILVDSEVIDEQRLGFAILYGSADYQLFEIYNTECVGGVCI